ncbi:hypothetical protein GCM10022280_24360 [Sphingomonas swuensis]|uniref:Ancillary SecYEG translocon subunit/Cell division coordinator CpoB TPR domain-containing protein n=1 Tax=Sphingomonas swuensis TaxID=977800 RepID=A0ABP7T9C7_9SPHN
MALAPGQTSESFIKEVDDNLRRSQAEEFAKRWGKWLIALAVLILLATGGYLYWRNQQAQQAAANSEAFSAILNDIGQNKSGDAGKRLETIAGNANDSMAAAARLTRAALSIQDGDRATAIAQYTQVTDDSGAPQAYRDAALIRRTQLEFDTLKPEDVIARMQPLAVKDGAWFGSAAELTALAMVKANRRSEAAQLLRAVAADKDVPATIKARTAELASSLSIPAAPAAAAAPTAPAAR